MKSFSPLFCSPILKLQDGNNNIIFKPKYLGQSWDSVIQILEPYDARYYQSTWQKGDSIYRGCVSIFEVPEKHKDGKVFSFTSSEIRENTISGDDSIGTKYFIIVDQ